MPSKLAVFAALAIYFPLPAFSLPYTSAYQGSNVICQDYAIEMTISPEIYLYNATKFSSNYDLTNFVTKSSTINSTSLFFPVEKEPVVHTFELDVHGTFCRPGHITAGKENTVIIATHGIGGDGSYWNSPYKPDKYNFVNAATAKGYSVFYYDRIGNGNSTKWASHHSLSSSLC
jgi:hypothetical protein